MVPPDEAPSICVEAPAARPDVIAIKASATNRSSFPAVALAEGGPTRGVTASARPFSHVFTRQFPLALSLSNTYATCVGRESFRTVLGSGNSG